MQEPVRLQHRWVERIASPAAPPGSVCCLQRAPYPATRQTSLRPAKQRCRAQSAEDRPPVRTRAQEIRAMQQNKQEMAERGLPKVASTSQQKAGEWRTTDRRNNTPPRRTTSTARGGPRGGVPALVSASIPRRSGRACGARHDGVRQAGTGNAETGGGGVRRRSGVSFLFVAMLGPWPPIVCCSTAGLDSSLVSGLCDGERHNDVDQQRRTTTGWKGGRRWV